MQVFSPPLHSPGLTTCNGHYSHSGQLQSMPSVMEILFWAAHTISFVLQNNFQRQLAQVLQLGGAALNSVSGTAPFEVGRCIYEHAGRERMGIRGSAVQHLSALACPTACKFCRVAWWASFLCCSVRNCNRLFSGFMIRLRTGRHQTSFIKHLVWMTASPFSTKGHP